MSDDIVKGNGDSGDKKKRPLSVRQQRLIAAYTDTDSPTYCNGARSYLAAGYRPTTDASTRACSAEALARPSIRSRIAEILAAEGSDTQDRVRRLTSTARGEARRTVKHLRADAGGELRVAEVVEQEPSFAERNQAEHILAKLSGDYLAPQVAATAANERYKAMYRQLWAAHNRHRPPAASSSSDPSAAASAAQAGEP